MKQDERAQRLEQWAREALQTKTGIDLAGAKREPVSGDASFRRYFRLRLPREVLVPDAGDSPLTACVLVDSPPEREDGRAFARIAALLREQELPAPRILEADFTAGFLVLEDFGDTLYLSALQQAREAGDEQRIDSLYRNAIEALLRMQAIEVPEDFPRYDREALRRETALFDEWFCRIFLQLPLDKDERKLLEQVYQYLEDAALAQPQVLVHRDFHSRNLMLRPGDEDGLPGIIDFQDAVHGPVSYDLVSLLRDCYIVWPEERQRQWLSAWLREAGERAIVPAGYSEADLLRDFDLMGLQRHLKVLGIFARLSLRDGKPAYLEDLPTVLRYVLQVTPRHSPLQSFDEWFRQRILPEAKARLPGLRE